MRKGCTCVCVSGWGGEGNREKLQDRHITDLEMGREGFKQQPNGQRGNWLCSTNPFRKHAVSGAECKQWVLSRFHCSQSCIHRAGKGMCLLNQFQSFCV